MKYAVLLALILLPLAATAQSLEPDASAGLRLNDIQAVGTHNSYKIAIPTDELAMIAARSPTSARALDYSHLPLARQLDLGMRQLEIDVVQDTDGGRYAHPLLPQLSGRTYDAAAMEAPGYKVLHMPDVDVRSHCATFIHCLDIIRDWSEKNPRHVPILILINAKEGGPSLPGGVTAPAYDAPAFDRLDAEIRTVFGPDRLISPDTVRRGATTLREAVLAGGWPDLEAARGKVFFALDEGPDKVSIYMRGHTSLEGLAMFVNSVSDAAPHAAYFTLNDPLVQYDHIRAVVRSGFVVRTRADAETLEARTNDSSRFAKALSSGAHYISTDYPTPRDDLSPYKVTLPGGVAARLNPITGQN